MLYQNLRFALPLQFLHHRHYHFQHFGKETGEWVIEKNNFRIHGEDTVDFKKLALLIREVVCTRLALLPQTNSFQWFFRFCKVQRAVPFKERAKSPSFSEHDKNIVQNRHLFKQPHILKGARQPVSGYIAELYFGKVELLRDDDFTRIKRYKAGEKID